MKLKSVWNYLFSYVFIGLFFVSTATAVELISNGDFETGGLAGWTVTTNGTSGCDQDWIINGNTCVSVGVAPSGSNFAYNSADGNGPQQFIMQQSFLVPFAPTSATLTWQQAVIFGFSGQARSLNVTFGNGITDTPVYTEIFSGSENYTWQLKSADLTSLLQSNVGVSCTIKFVVDIPESFTGGAGMGVDLVSLLAVDTTDPTFSNLAVDITPAQAGQTVAITFVASESLQANPVVTVNGNSATFVSAVGLNYTYSYTVTVADPIAFATIDIAGSDLAANPGLLSDSSTLEIIAVPQPVPLAMWPGLMALAAAGALVLRKKKA